MTRDTNDRVVDPEQGSREPGRPMYELASTDNLDGLLAVLPPDIAAAAGLVRSGALVASAGVDLPWTEGAT